ncbi:hypothetical protein CYMTET_40210 [Cymbomonas tetramitiformis]|uniref:Uncharacterized protein n=1 Tax=Cymbomonas tetramitiformis TaxID=36881 RepID=A0AAE0C8K1_9CHLO|nr:hypothetical protein CYMTET_40210 [Cymbomonas tetramitiformis]
MVSYISELLSEKNTKFPIASNISLYARTVPTTREKRPAPWKTAPRTVCSTKVYNNIPTLISKHFEVFCKVQTPVYEGATIQQIRRTF